MNKLILLILFLAIPLLAADWEWLNPKPHGNSLNDIDTIDEDKAVAVGALGTIMRTDDGGQNWETIFQVNNFYGDLFAVQFVSEYVGWAAGEWGTILQTKDGGVSWEFKKSGSTMDLYSLYFINKDTGWAAGRWGNVLKTTDAGETWGEQSSGTYRRLSDICFFDDSLGLAVGHGGTIIKTENGGETWTEKVSGIESNLQHICFCDSSLCWVVGEDSTILKSSDSGESWTAVSSHTTYDLASISFADADTGWAVGFHAYDGTRGEIYKTTGAILKTTDGGQNWIEVVKDSIYALNALSLKNGSGWASGDAGTIFKLENGGFQSHAQNNLVSVGSLHFVDEQLGYGAGGNMVARTTDGGQSWSTQWLDINQSIQSVDFVNAQKGYISGFYLMQTMTNIELNAIIMGTDDGGETWHQQYYNDWDLLIGVEAVNDSVAYAVGTRLNITTGNIRGLVLKTNNGGQDWQALPFNSAIILYWASFSDENTGWVVGESSTIFHTSDGGATWERQRPGVANGLYTNVDFIDSQHGWACGLDGVIIATADGGQTWSQQNTNTFCFLYDIEFVDERTGYVVGEEGTILNTLDGGLTWTPEETTTNVMFYSLSFPSISTGYVAGDRGIILKTTNGVSDVKAIQWEKNAPSSITLYQNFPNPFNPQTTIKFSLPSTNRVTLKVYNVLGKEVATLVDKSLQAGEHTVDFDAAHLASGLYLYHLKAGDFAQTKKMIVQK
ncbi:T9SS type A sorting domain-containing protein [candidate division KSB1 bacterium]|nr:T9SS type A sorting domain-containing protein [candidate division KSB1 bacterium]